MEDFSAKYSIVEEKMSNMKNSKIHKVKPNPNTKKLSLGSDTFGRCDNKQSYQSA